MPGTHPERDPNLEGLTEDELHWLAMDTLPPPARTSLPPIRTATHDFESRVLSVMQWAFPLAITAIALSLAGALKGPDPSGRAEALEACKHEARYTDALDILRVDPWATAQCMRKKGYTAADAPAP